MIINDFFCFWIVKQGECFLQYVRLYAYLVVYRFLIVLELGICDINFGKKIIKINKQIKITKVSKYRFQLQEVERLYNVCLDYYSENFNVESCLVLNKEMLFVLIFRFGGNGLWYIRIRCRCLKLYFIYN